MGLGTKKESAWFFFSTPSYSPILYSILLLLRILNPLIISRTKREGLSSMWIMTSKQKTLSDIRRSIQEISRSRNSFSST